MALRLSWYWSCMLRTPLQQERTHAEFSNQALQQTFQRVPVLGLSLGGLEGWAAWSVWHTISPPKARRGVSTGENSFFGAGGGHVYFLEGWEESPTAHNHPLMGVNTSPDPTIVKHLYSRIEQPVHFAQSARYTKEKPTT